MSNYKNELPHAINGVNGRIWTIKNPGVRASGCFDAQKWVSESRPIKGYGTNGVMHVEIRFDDECKNGHNTFAITANVYTMESRRMRDIAAGGCMHEDIARIFPELAHLIKWHLCGIDSPMHYVANTVYHAKANGPTHAWVYYTGSIDPLNIGESKERLLTYCPAAKVGNAEGWPGYRVQWDDKTIKVANFDYARSSAVWPDATDAELSVDPETLKGVLMARLPGLLASMRADIEAMGFVWQASDVQRG